MLPCTTHGPTTAPRIILLHWLGGSAGTWTETAASLAARGLATIALDLPGFGHAASLPAYPIAASIEQILTTLDQLQLDTPWLLAGHSMGGKFATILARAAADGHPGLAHLRGLVLVSPSPPGPEPMADADRQHNLDTLGHPTADPADSRHQAQAFVDANIGKVAPAPGIRERTIEDLLRMDRAAFAAWMNHGSREDWAARVGTLPYPALLLAGTEEPALNPAAQARHTLPHLPSANLVALQGSGHLSPLERPAELAARIAAFARSLGLVFQRPNAALSPDFRAVLDSGRTSPQTRAVLLQRLADDHAPSPASPLASEASLTPEASLTLDAIAERILPGCPFDLTDRIRRWLALPLHDGWRHDTLPPDVEAWRTGLHSINAASLHEHHVPFIALPASLQDTLLAQARDGKLSSPLLNTINAVLHGSDEISLFTAAQLAQWFGDLHAELTRTYIADPRIYERIGFTGFADGADAVRDAGFTHITLSS